MYSGSSAREFGVILYEAAVFGGEVTNAATAPALLFRLTGVGVVETDLTTGRFLQVNRAFCEMVGYSEAELLSMTNAELTHPDDWGRDAEYFAALQQGDLHQAQALTRVLRKDGQVGWLELHVTVIGEGDETINLAVANDVTGRVRSEGALRRAAERDAFRVTLSDALSPLADPLAVQEEAARVLAEHLQTDGVHYTEIDETQTRYRVARDFTRGDVPSMVGTYPVAAFPWLGPEFLAGGRIVVADAQASPLIPEADRAAVAAIGVRALVTVPLLKGGRFVAALSAVSATPREWTPEEVELVGGTAERTWAALEHARAETALRELNETLEQKVAERTEALRVSEQRFAQAFYTNPIPACMTSFGRETFVNVNDAFSELTGYAHAEAVGRTSRELGMWSSPKDQQRLGEVQRGEKGFHNLELRLKTKEGGVRDVLMSAAVVRLDGHEGYLKMFYDVSERKRTEEQMHRAIQAVMNDASWFSRSLIEQLGRIRTGGEAPVSVPFSKREREVLERIAHGLNNDAIAAELGLAPQTVRNYVATIYDKIGVHTRVEAVVWARERGIVG